MGESGAKTQLTPARGVDVPGPQEKEEDGSSFCSEMIMMTFATRGSI